MATKPAAPDHSWHTPYLRALEISGVPEPRQQWFVRWAELFIEFLKEEPLHVADRHDAEALVHSLESVRRMESWRLKQASDALRLLLTAVYGKRWQPGRTAHERVSAHAGSDPLRAACRAGMTPAP